jgi:hypothetical protein
MARERRASIQIERHWETSVRDLPGLCLKGAPLPPIYRETVKL